MKSSFVLALAAIASACIISLVPVAAGQTDNDASPIFGVKIPQGYRDWEMVAVSHEAGLDELRGVLGNDVAMKAYREGTLPFPDGTVLAKLAWKHVPVPGVKGAFVTGDATTVQIMVKDSRKYASSGGWGVGRFLNSKPVAEVQHKTGSAGHEAKV